VDVRERSDREVALLLREFKIDIAVDLKGYTRDSRPGILAFRPAPIQVNYLGYPGTMGAKHIDYLIADRFVIPEREQPYYAEQIAYLPETYQPNDATRRIGEHVPTRAQAGLPAQGFVFCSFNSNYKITPAMFDCWMRVLAQVPGSVLWLLASNAAAMRNLRLHAQSRGVDAERLRFAERVTQEQHLARHRLAGLFLDNLPINAHTTASDALWAGLPVLTCPGRSFAGRVAGSLLAAVGLPELIAPNLEDFEARAIALARDEQSLGAIRARLARNRQSFPLFDTSRLCRHLERAYEMMWQRFERGEPPAGFAVPACD
jgi:predicted O-linked N-acetylglucosamine transferase (SPINDLY family)